MTKPRRQKIHFSLLFVEHRFPYYDRLTSEIFNTFGKHPNLVNYVSDSVYRA